MNKKPNQNKLQKNKEWKISTVLNLKPISITKIMEKNRNVLKEAYNWAVGLIEDAKGKQQKLEYNKSLVSEWELPRWWKWTTS